MCTGMVLGISWARYQESPIIGQSVFHLSPDKNKTSPVPTQVTTEHVANWFIRWTATHSSFFVAPSFQLTAGSIDSLTELTPPNTSDNSQAFHLTATLTPRFSSVEKLSANPNFLLLKDSDGVLHSDWIIIINRDKHGHVITEMMLPARYDIMTNPELLTDPGPAEKLPDTTVAYTYRIADRMLSVSYDFGHTWIAVPHAYDAVTHTNNGSNDTNLPRGSYVISPDFTGFIGFDDNQARLIFSTDSGASWSTTSIGSGYPAPRFLSYADGHAIATFAQERAGGSDYYVSWRSDVSSHFSKWSQQPLFRDFPPNLSLSSWLSADNGFIGYPAEEPAIYATFDGGVSYQDVTLDIVLPGYSTPEFFYRDEDIYAIIRQGSDGDDTVNGNMQEAVYRFDEKNYILTFVRKQDAPITIDVG